MSSSPGRREVAHRLFAAEYDDASLEYAESDEERAPNYVVTPAGARVNRLFVVGVLTSVEQVNEDTVRARIADPTGAFVVYAGQYQPDELAALQSLDAPAFVAVTGKANTFQPDGSDRVLTSVRPESVTEVDAETRDRWVVTAAEHTLGRVETAADALGRDEHGDELVALLRSEGVDPGLAEGVERAIDHYGTTADYLGELRELALQAVEVVAGERSEAESLDLDPDESAGRFTPGDLADGAPEAAAAVTEVAGPIEDVAVDEADADADGTADEDAVADQEVAGGTDAAADAGATGDAGDAGTSAADATGTEAEESTADDAGGATETSDASAASDTTESSDADATDADVDAAAGTAETDDSTADATTDDATDATTGTTTDADDVDESDLDDGDLDDVVDDEERERIEEEYGVGFESGAEVDDPGEADIEPPEEPAGDADADDSSSAEASSADAGADAAESAADADASATSEDAGADADADTDADAGGADDTEDDAAQGDEDAAADDAPTDADDAGDVDLEAALLEQMEALDEGDGAERADLVEAVADETGADDAAVEDAIEDALMSGKCYEPSEGTYKPI